MRKIDHHYFVQKDLSEYWSAELGWLHCGDLVRTTGTDLRRGGLGMVIGFMSDHNRDETVVAILDPRNPENIQFSGINYLTIEAAG